MSLPELVRSLLGEESVTAEVPLGGEDALYVTPTRTLRYRADGLLSDESVDQYGHDAERVAVSEGRRKSKVVLDYGLDGEERFSVPTKRLEDALEPIVAGVLGSNGVLDDDEAVRRLFRFSELTVVVTDARVVKHIGAAVWDGEFEEFGFADVSDLDFEDGSVATSVVLTVGGRQERFKAPNEEARAVRETLKAAVLAYHDAPNLPALREAAAPDDGAAGPEEDGDAAGGSVDFGDGPDPLSAEPAAEAEAGAEAEPETGAPAEADRGAGGRRPESGAGSGAASTGTGTAADAGAGPDTGTDTTVAEGSGSEPESRSESTAAVAGTAASRSGRGDAAPSPERSAGSTPASGPDPGASSGAGYGVGAGSASNAVGGTEAAADTRTPTADATGDSGGDDEFGDSGFQPAGPVDEADVAARLADLTAAVERQNEEIGRQRETFERLIEELRRGR